jgi:DNA-binding response OmpR family regulator
LALLLCPDEEVHDLLEGWLSAAGFEVATVESGAEAGAQVQSRSAKLLVLDALPTRFGNLPSLRGLKQSRAFHVVLVPRIGETAEAGLAYVAGVDVVLRRPLTRSALLSALARLN